MNIRQRIAQWFYSPGAYGLWVALDDVENWRHWSGHVWEYSRNRKVIIRMACGSRFRFDEYDTEGFLGWFERLFLWSKFKSLERRRKRIEKKRRAEAWIERNRETLYRLTRLEDPK